MKKIVAFLMAFALCVMCFGTYGFADVTCNDEGHDHSHVVHAADDFDTNYLYLNEAQTSYTYNETAKKLTLSLVIDSESMEKGVSGVIEVKAPYTAVLGKPTLAGISGYVFGTLASTCATITSSANPGTTSTSTIRFNVQSVGTDAGFNQYAIITIEYPVDPAGLSYSWLRQAQFNLTGSVQTISGLTVPFDTRTSTFTAYVCKHAVTDERVKKEATCQAAGEKEIYCMACGYIVETKTIFPTDHDFDFSKPYNTNLYPYKAATCSTYGSGCFKCNDCGILTTATIPKLEHKFGDRILLNGIYYYECTVCEALEKAVNQCPHNLDNYVLMAVLTESTCATKGTGRYKCPECNQIEERDLPLAEHTFASSVITTAATCTATGKKTSTCAACGKGVIETIDALGHDFGDWRTQTAATCVQNGTDIRSCSRCTATETKQVSGSGHQFGSWITTVPASCVSTGTETRVCTLCNMTQSQTISMVAHTYGAWSTTTPATCVAAGVETRVCSVCSDAQTRAINPITENHKFGEWTTVLAKTCVTDGEKARTCEYCSYVETETDACTGHVFGADVVDGKLTTKTCGVCSYKEITKTVKDGMEKTLSSSAGTLTLVGAEATKNYVFELSVPDVEKEAYYKQYLDFYKAYTFKVLVDGEVSSVNDSMKLAITTDPLLENYEVSVVRLVGNSFYPINEFDRKGDQVIIPGSELVGADLIFVVKGAEVKPNIVLPIVITVVTLAIAGAAIYIFMSKNKRRMDF